MTTVSACSSLPVTLLPNAALPTGFCAYEVPVTAERPRSIRSISSSGFIFLERTTSSVVLAQDTDGDGLADSRQVLVTIDGLNHGMALNGGYLYASTSDIVYRWPIVDDFVIQNTTPETVIFNMNDDGKGNSFGGGHSTRTLVFDSEGRLYVSVGSVGNVDEDSFRSRVRRFSLLGELPIDFTTGTVFADGVRNEVGLAFDRFNILWGVENGADNLRRDDLGGFITNDNPAEELHRFATEGQHYGYPYCWTEYLLEQGGMGRGTAWAWPSFLNETVTDQECRTNYAAAEVAMQAHSAPLGICFYEFNEDRPGECQNVMPFPQEMDGYAFIAFHGSWNRQIPTGYKVVYVPVNTTGRATGQPVDLLAHVPPNAQWEDGFRPVDVSFDDCGRLLVSSDGSGGKIVRIESVSSTVAPSEPPASAPSETPASTSTTCKSRLTPGALLVVALALFAIHR